MGNKVAVGEGGAKTLDRKRARRSTERKLKTNLEFWMARHRTITLPCFVLCTFSAISLRRSGDLLPPTARLRSLEALNNASKRSRSRPWPRTGESLGRSGDNCLGERGDTAGGGDSRAGLGLSGSCMKLGFEAENGENGSLMGTWGGAGEMAI